MTSLFIGITLVNLLGLGVTIALGYGVSAGRDWSTYHQLGGVLATITTCAVHCIVFTYFIATAKWVQHAVTVKKLDQSLVGPTKSFRAQAFPAALLSMFAVFFAAVVGAATFSYHSRPIYHHAAALSALVINLLAAPLEYRAIVRNGNLIDNILERAKHPAT